ncbi:FecR domain-containing protein [Chitinophaga pollutisoli]|uniref:FecR domain-containing protein n=1 Tax=Chitinophaga pollutisoli TaxID=3133966 RepID=A0ABZ2YRI3_9BACT
MPGQQREELAYYQQLIRKLMEGTITEAEREQLEDWYNTGMEDPVQIPASFVPGEAEHEARLLARIRDKAGISTGTRVVPWRRHTWRAAAVIFLIGGAATFFILNQRNPAKPAAQPATMAQDVKAPRSSRATITLGDGSQLVLDSLANGATTTQSNTQIIKLDGGEIAYNGSASENSAPVFNTLNNPRGSQVVSITLSDGTRVWLNAGSSLTYPVVFHGRQRNVELKGEGYFEVAKKNGQRFVVTARGTQTEVLGTHFNINAYTEESATTITLLEGAVQLHLSGNTHPLRPGEQASVTPAGNITTTRPDLDQVMAWKKGDFYFTGTDIETVMRQAARWYDLEVEYRGKVTGTLSGDVSRSVNASELFQMLELTGRVSFEIEGRKVIVIPK